MPLRVAGVPPSVLLSRRFRNVVQYVVHILGKFRLQLSIGAFGAFCCEAVYRVLKEARRFNQQKHQQRQKEIRQQLHKDKQNLDLLTAAHVGNADSSVHALLSAHADVDTVAMFP